MGITFSSLDSISCWSHEIASEYHITWPRQCLSYATIKNESDLDLQDQDLDLDLQDQDRIKNVILKDLI